MSWISTYQSPHVEQRYDTATVPTTPAQSSAAPWSTCTTESRLKPSSYAHPICQTLHTRPLQEIVPNQQTRGSGLYLDANSLALKHSSGSPTNSAHPRPQPRPAQPKLPRPVATLQISPNPSPAPKTPTSSVSWRTARFTSNTQTMQPQYSPSLQRNRAQGMSSVHQRQAMGPPETPSRGMIPPSPGLFSNLQFSPDMFAPTQQTTEQQQQMSSYPQQRLFWDPSTATPLQTTPQQFHTPVPFPNDFDTSFNSQTTIMPQSFMMSHEEMPYDLPETTQSMHTSFMDTSVYPAPFQTSPRVHAPPQENPTHFLSSPARRFGGDTRNSNDRVTQMRPTLPAYHHQIQESKREKELARERRRSRALRRQTDEDVLMQSVRRALSPTKRNRPSLTRSLTTQGLSTIKQHSDALIDNISLTSGSTSESMRGGRSSPIRRDHSMRASAASRLRHSASMNLAIDARGTARTVMTTLPEDAAMGLDDYDENDDGDTDVLSSDDEPQDMLHSFHGDPYNDMRTLGDARDELRSTNPYIGRGPGGHARTTSSTFSDSHNSATIRRPRTQTMNSANSQQSVHDTAQSALRAIIQERSHSTSSHENQSSNSSMQFHSSPPLQHNTLANFSNRSLGTPTDPNLLTPGTDVDSVGSITATRCVCNSTSSDGNIMIQCDSCNKWLHASCVGLRNKIIPEIYICTFCEQTPIRPGTTRAAMGRQLAISRSPLAHKSRMDTGRDTVRRAGRRR